MCPPGRLLWRTVAPANPRGALGHFLEEGEDDVRAGMSPDGTPHVPALFPRSFACLD